MIEFEVRCPECGVDVAHVPPCRICGGYCCKCYHDEDDLADAAERADRAASAR